MLPNTKDTNMLVYFALADAKVPNANGFASRWNIGFTVYFVKFDICNLPPYPTSSFSVHLLSFSVCYSSQEAVGCRSVSGFWFNNTCFNLTYIRGFETDFTKCVVGVSNSTDVHQGAVSCSYVISNVMQDDLQADTGWRRTVAAEEFFK